MDFFKGLRLLAASLIIFMGVAYFAESVLGLTATGFEAAWYALFGLLYIIVGIGLFAYRRLFNYLGVVIPLVGLSVGLYYFAALSQEPFVLAVASIEVMVILFCFYLTLHETME